jgi:hypothetical protein
MNTRPLHAFWLTCLLACGDKGTTETPAAEPAAPAPAAPAPTAAAEPAKPSIEDTSFRLAFEKPGALTAGTPGKVQVVLEPKGGYHVNQDYPIRVDLKAKEGVKLDKASLAKPDASTFSEQSARFDVGFTADKGTHDVEATVDFAVCTSETCVPDQRTIAIALDVQ